MTTPRRPARPLVVIAEDEHLIAVDKPPGLLTVPAPGRSVATLADQVRRMLLARGEECRPVHRLDRDTSGVVVFAKSRAAEEGLIDLFRARQVQKTYLALVGGRMRPSRGTIRSYIVDRGKTARSSRRPIAGGKEAITDYRVVETFEHATLVEARPRTGRFNQIRLHMVDVGCPIVGERKYATASRQRTKFRRPLLHAAEIAFRHPVSKKNFRAAATLPADFDEVLRELRGDDR